MQILTGFGLLAALWFAVHAALWGAANTLDTVALALHRFAAHWRELQRRKTAALSQEWMMTLERGLARPTQPDEAFLSRAGIRDGYTGE